MRELIELKKRLHRNVPEMWNPSHWEPGHDAGRCGLFNTVVWDALKTKVLRLRACREGGLPQRRAPKGSAPEGGHYKGHNQWFDGSKARLVLSRCHCFVEIPATNQSIYVLDLTCQQIEEFRDLAVLFKPRSWVLIKSEAQWWDRIVEVDEPTPKGLIEIKRVVSEDFPENASWEDLRRLIRAGF